MLRSFVLTGFPSEELECGAVVLLALELVAEEFGGCLMRAMVRRFCSDFGSGVEQFMRKKKAIKKTLSSTKK